MNPWAVMQRFGPSTSGGGGFPSTWNAAMAALPGLWGWWKLDETAANGVTAIDSSGNSRNGTYVANGTRGTGLIGASAFSQATLGGVVSLPTYTFPTNAKFTVGAVVKTTISSSAEQQILSGDSSSRAFQFRKNATTHALEFVTIYPAVTTTTGVAAINDGNPHLVMAVFDQTLPAASGVVKLYVDGVLDKVSTTAITISNTLSPALGIGTRGGGVNTGLWGGSIDECFFCADALAADRIAALWAVRNS